MNDQLTLEDWAIVFWRLPWHVGWLMRSGDHIDAEVMLARARRALSIS